MGNKIIIIYPTLLGRVFHELNLNESIRYADKDPVEKWLNGLLCLDASVIPRMSSGCPAPQTCDLYYVNRDTLFSYHKAAEGFLHRIMALYVSSHYKVRITWCCLKQCHCNCIRYISWSIMSIVWGHFLFKDIYNIHLILIKSIKAVCIFAQDFFIGNMTISTSW